MTSTVYDLFASKETEIALAKVVPVKLNSPVLMLVTGVAYLVSSVAKLEMLVEEVPVAFGAVTVPALIVSVSPLASPKVVLPFALVEPLTVRVVAVAVPEEAVVITDDVPTIALKLVVPVSVVAANVPPVVVPLRVKLPDIVPVMVGLTKVRPERAVAMAAWLAVEVQKSSETPSDCTAPVVLLMRRDAWGKAAPSEAAKTKRREIRRRVSILLRWCWRCSHLGG